MPLNVEPALKRVGSAVTATVAEYVYVVPSKEVCVIGPEPGDTVSHAPAPLAVAVA